MSDVCVDDCVSGNLCLTRYSENSVCTRTAYWRASRRESFVEGYTMGYTKYGVACGWFGLGRCFGHGYR